MKKINIKTQLRNYPVLIGDSVLESVNDLINTLILNKNLFVVVDEKVFNLHKKYITDVFNDKRLKIDFYKFNASEHSKSFEGLKKILSELINKKYSRDTLLISIGGGVTGDISGFASSVYMRGIQIANIPTTLLACVDSAIGGKTGINFNNYKNIIGAFHQPQFVLIDTKFISTLPKEEIISGAGEIIKYAFLTDKNFFNYVFNNIEKIYSLDKKVLNKIIYESVIFKSSVVTNDEFERGLRKILNLGHTFGHAYESASGYLIKHGEAVVIGIISALFLSFKKDLLSKKKLNQFLQLTLKMKFSQGFKIIDYNKVLEYMKADKKNNAGEIKFVLLAGIGKIITEVNANESEIRYAIEETKNILFDRN